MSKRKIDFEVVIPEKAVVDVKTHGPKAVEVLIPGGFSISCKDGYTPIKGLDYFTEADKLEFLASVMDSLAAETWVFTLEDGSTVEKQVLVR